MLHAVFWINQWKLNGVIFHGRIEIGDKRVRKKIYSSHREDN
jgi:hypothetical protein